MPRRSRSSGLVCQSISVAAACGSCGMRAAPASKATTPAVATDAESSAKRSAEVASTGARRRSALATGFLIGLHPFPVLVEHRARVREHVAVRRERVAEHDVLAAGLRLIERHRVVLPARAD